MEFEKEIISLNIPIPNGIKHDNWTIRPLTTTKVTTYISVPLIQIFISPQLCRSDVDSYEPGQMIPALQIEAIPPEQVNSLTYWLELIGIKNSSDNKLSISIQLPSYEGVYSPPPSPRSEL